MKERRGYTLAEVLVVIIIVAILAAVAIPGFSKSKTKADKNQAIAYLRTIRAAEKMYYGKWRTYMNFANTNAATIKAALGVEASIPGAMVQITATSVAFTAAMTDSSGKTLTLNQAGSWGGTNTPLPATDA